MCNLSKESETKVYEMRKKGKIPNQAHGDQGEVGAMKKMSGEHKGLSEAEMKKII